MNIYLRRGFKEFWVRVRLLSIELLIVLVAFFISMAAFIFLARMVFLQKREEMDLYFFSYFETQINSLNTGVMQFFSFMGSHYFLIPANILLAAFFLLVKKQRWYSIKIPVISLSSLLLMFLLKAFFHRERPLDPLLKAAKGLSFPSGHALMSFAFYGLIIYSIWSEMENKVLKVILISLLVFLILFIGISRIYLRVHYASDVLAGFSLGLIWLVFSLFVLNRLEHTRLQPQIDNAVTSK